MRPSRFSDDQITQAIAQVNCGTPLVAMCRQLGVTQTTFYRWRRKYGDGTATEPHEARTLRQENLRLRQLVADLSLERQMLQASLTKHAKSVR